MSRDWSSAPIYNARDVRAAEVDGRARGWDEGYLAGYRDRCAGLDADAGAQAAAFATLVHHAFTGLVSRVEIVRRRAEASGHPHVFAAELAAAQAQAARLQIAPTPTAPRRAAA